MVSMGTHSSASAHSSLLVIVGFFPLPHLYPLDSEYLFDSFAACTMVYVPMLVKRAERHSVLCTEYDCYRLTFTYYMRYLYDKYYT